MALTKTQELLQMKGQIAQMTAVNNEQAVRILKLEADLKSANSTKDMWYSTHTQSEKKFNELLEFVNHLPGIIPELKEDGYTKVPLITRLALWIATHNLKQETV